MGSQGIRRTKWMATGIKRFVLGTFTPFVIKVVPVFTDNYSYILETPTATHCLVIDPADPSAVLPHLSKPVEYILNTHHHEYSALLNCSNFGDECTFSDHSGGNFGMKKAFPNALICGFDGRIPALDHKLDNFELLKFGDLTVKTVHVPCHTKGSVCFLVYEKDETLQFPAVVFTGDTIFLGGCGRFFEGSAADMAKVFNILHAELGQDTLVFTGHEYTLSNLRFAALADPQNSRLIERKKRLEAQALRSPEWEPFATWEEECLTNPFLRCDSEAIKRFTGKSDPIEALAELRKLKNNF